MIDIISPLRIAPPFAFGAPTPVPPPPQPPPMLPSGGREERKWEDKPDEPVDYAEVLRRPARLYIFGYAPLCYLGSRVSVPYVHLTLHAASVESQMGTLTDGASLALAGALPDSLLIHQLPPVLLEVGGCVIVASAESSVTTGEIVIVGKTGEVVRG